MQDEISARFKSARELFPITDRARGTVYFNSASTGPLCFPVKKAMERYYDQTQYLDRDTDHEAFDNLDRVRRLGAKMIGAQPDEVGFGFNTGFGLNIAAQGLPLRPGDEILLSDIEFPSNIYPWLALREIGMEINFVKSAGRYFDIDNFKKSITKKTRVLSLSFVQFLNGYKNDLTAIGKICREHDMYFVVDGIQGCGVEPLDVREAGVDIFSAGAQKWLLAPLGAGIFFVRKDLQKELRHPWASWLAVDWKMNFSDLFHYDLPYFDSARQYELGTYPYAHVHALAASLGLIDSLGVADIQRHNRRLLDMLIDFIKDDPFYGIRSSLADKHRSSILAFGCPDAARVHRELLNNKIICSLREGAIRISVHLFNNESDMERLREILSRISGNSS